MKSQISLLTPPKWGTNPLEVPFHFDSQRKKAALMDGLFFCIHAGQNGLCRFQPCGNGRKSAIYLFKESLKNFAGPDLGDF